MRRTAVILSSKPPRIEDRRNVQKHKETYSHDQRERETDTGQIQTQRRKLDRKDRNADRTNSTAKRIDKAVTHKRERLREKERRQKRDR